ncbi:MAG: hypothetical protein ACKORY_03670, partial [Actinomycetota bacterium]
LSTPDQLKGASVKGRVVGTAKGPKINGFTYESIYHRAESRAQATAVIDMLRALVDAYVASPHLLPGRADGSLDSGTDGAAHAAVAYVGGMTDRFACRQAVTLLRYPADRLPQGIDTLLSG